MYEMLGLLLSQALRDRQYGDRPAGSQEDEYYARFSLGPLQRIRLALAGKPAAARKRECPVSLQAADHVVPIRAQAPCRIPVADPRLEASAEKGEGGHGKQGAAGAQSERCRPPEESVPFIARLGDSNCTCSAI